MHTCQKVMSSALWTVQWQTLRKWQRSKTLAVGDSVHHGALTAFRNKMKASPEKSLIEATLEVSRSWKSELRFKLRTSSSLCCTR